MDICGSMDGLLGKYYYPMNTIISVPKRKGKTIWKTSIDTRTGTARKQLLLYDKKLVIKQQIHQMDAKEAKKMFIGCPRCNGSRIENRQAFPRLNLQMPWCLLFLEKLLTREEIWWNSQTEDESLKHGRKESFSIETRLERSKLGKHLTSRYFSYVSWFCSLQTYTCWYRY